jgi:hypothetical protein
MKKNGITAHPWDFTMEYKIPIECFVDKNNELKYVLHHDKKLFFPKTMSLEQVQNVYRSLIIEQDIRSPHRYLENDYSMLSDKVVLDIGSAEGIFSLDAIEYAKQIYLFESDSRWIEALRATFSPWSNKVTIISKYVGSENNENEITIDYFLSIHNHPNLFLKMDI